MTTTTYLWDELSDNVIEECEGSTLSATYTHEPTLYGNLVSQRRGVESHQYQFDARGDARELTELSGNTTDTRLYDAWGNLLASTGTTITPFQFFARHGYQWDSVSQTYYARERTYSSRIASWLNMTYSAFHDAHTPSPYLNLSPIHTKVTARIHPFVALLPIIGVQSSLQSAAADLASQHLPAPHLTSLISPTATAANCADEVGCSEAVSRVQAALEKTLQDYFDNAVYEHPGYQPWKCPRPRVTCCRRQSGGRGCKYCNDHPGLAGASIGREIVICEGNFPDQNFIETVLHEYQHSIDRCIHKVDGREGANGCWWDICSEISANVNSGKCGKNKWPPEFPNQDACIIDSVKASFAGTGSACAAYLSLFLKSTNIMAYCKARRPHFWPEDPRPILW